MRINESAVSLAVVGVVGAAILISLVLRVDGAKEICLTLGGGLVGFLGRAGLDNIAKTQPAADGQ